MFHRILGFHPACGVDGAALASLESQSRCIARPALAMDALEKLDDGTLSLETPPDSRTRATRVVLDPLEWIHRITAHIPDPGSHCQRFYGAYSNRGRIVCNSWTPTFFRPVSGWLLQFLQ